MNKRLVIPLMAVFAVGLVMAGVYVVNSLTLTVGVNEAFVVSYAVLGDAGDYDGATCASLTDDDARWFTSEDTSIPTGGFFPMESRRVCVRIENLGEASIPYVITSRVTNDNSAGDCVKAFPNQDISGMATGEEYTLNGVTVQIAADATPVAGCNVKIEVGRGSN